MHKVDNDTKAKFKVDHKGFVEAIVTRQVTHSLSVGLSSGFNVKSDSIERQRVNSLPFGIQIDLTI